MANVDMNELKAAVIAKTEETGSLPTTVTYGKTQYTLQMPVETKMSALQAVRNPARLDDILDGVTFVGSDGTQVTA
jgi:hypothetical protein